MIDTLAVRGEAIDRRTYRRPLDDAGSLFESRDQMLDRMSSHTRRLWSDALSGRDALINELEIAELRQLMALGLCSLSGRTRWLGGTPLSYSRPATQFNCVGRRIRTVYDAVDAFWLLLLGSGVGFIPEAGVLCGFSRPLPVTVVGSVLLPGQKGRPTNAESFNPSTGEWRISVGDSAEAWAKALGKLLIHKHPARSLVLDFSQVRQPGGRLKGFGWICNGWVPLSRAFLSIAALLNTKAGSYLLDIIDIIDLLNHLGTVLSTRRSAEIACVPSHHPLADQFFSMKDRVWEPSRHHRQQSNNTLFYFDDPSETTLLSHLQAADSYGGGDPALANGRACLERAPWFIVGNPCLERFLSNGGVCNLVEINLAAHGRNIGQLMRTAYLVARANYRQTCVNLEDGILQPDWHQTNESLRLCGVGVTGICQSDHLSDYDLRTLRYTVTAGAYSMADELDLPRPKSVTCIKPSGTLSKVLRCVEGIHRPIGKHIFNWVGFNQHDPLLSKLEEARFRTLPHPTDPAAVLVNFPVSWPDVRFSSVNGRSVNLEPAVSQLDRYSRWMRLFVDDNASCTISYSEDELPSIASWLHSHWRAGDFAAVSFAKRLDPTKTAADYGQLYLPQEVVTEETYSSYASTLKEPDWSYSESGIHDLIDAPDCSAGCPVR